MKKKIFISAYPFCATNNNPIKLLKKNNFYFKINHKNRRLNEKEIKEILQEYDGLIADTEPLTANVLKECKKLKIISRVGIGVNNIDLNFVKKKNIIVTNTPDAPTMAVVELTLGLILNALRGISIHNNLLKKNIWVRNLGKRISGIKIGIIGLGRIGSRVAKSLVLLGAKKIYYNDIEKKITNKNIIFKSKQYIYKHCNVISLHLPLNKKTYNLINAKVMRSFKKDTILINTARGEVLNEKDLFKFLKKNELSFAACDVFQNEPYYGQLLKIKNFLGTPHIGSMSIDCREKMEIEATNSVVNFFLKKKIKNIVH